MEGWRAAFLKTTVVAFFQYPLSTVWMNAKHFGFFSAETMSTLKLARAVSLTCTDVVFIEHFWQIPINVIQHKWPVYYRMAPHGNVIEPLLACVLTVYHMWLCVAPVYLCVQLKRVRDVMAGAKLTFAFGLCSQESSDSSNTTVEDEDVKGKTEKATA